MTKTHVCNISMYLLWLSSYATRKYATKLRLKPKFVKALDIHPKAQPSIAAFGPSHWSKWILVILSSRAWEQKKNNLNLLRNLVIGLFWKKLVILMGFRCPLLGAPLDMPVLFSLEANIWLRNKRQKKSINPVIQRYCHKHHGNVFQLHMS